MPNEARSFVARAIAEDRELGLYSLPVRALPPTVDELARTSVRRFRDLLAEVRASNEPALVVEGIELFPTSVAAVLRSPEHALFLLPGGEEELDPLSADVARAIERDTRDLRLRVLRADRPLEELASLAIANAGVGTSP